MSENPFDQALRDYKGQCLRCSGTGILPDGTACPDAPTYSEGEQFLARLYIGAAGLPKQGELYSRESMLEFAAKWPLEEVWTLVPKEEVPFGVEAWKLSSRKLPQCRIQTICDGRKSQWNHSILACFRQINLTMETPRPEKWAIKHDINVDEWIIAAKGGYLHMPERKYAMLSAKTKAVQLYEQARSARRARQGKLLEDFAKELVDRHGFAEHGAKLFKDQIRRNK